MAHPALDLITEQLRDLPHFVTCMSSFVFDSDPKALHPFFAMASAQQSAPAISSPATLLRQKNGRGIDFYFIWRSSDYDFGFSYPVEIRFPENYPEEAPQLRFACIFDHFNVSQEGFLRPASNIDRQLQWRSTMNVSDFLSFVRRCIDHPVYPEVYMH
jgi:ubiquitin-protein ligase